MTGLYFILFYFHALWQWVTGKIQKIYISPPCDSSSAVQCRAVQSQVPVLVEILTLLYVFNFRHKLTLLWKTLSIYIQDMFFSPQAPPRFLRIYGALSRPLGQKDSSCLRPSESFWPWGLLGGALWEINISTNIIVRNIRCQNFTDEQEDVWGGKKTTAKSRIQRPPPVI